MYSEQLKERLGVDEILAVYSQIREKQSFLQFAELLFSEDERVARNAAWVLTKLSDDEILQILPIRNRIIDLILETENSAVRRLNLNIVERFPMTVDNIRTDFLDFCLEKMRSLDEPPGVQCLCMKLACTMCNFYPELKGEFKRTLEAMEISYYNQSMKLLRKKMLKKSSQQQ